jgi:ABC-type uncharacterized transport system substrate-binding protein
MRRRELIALIGGAAFARPLVARAQQPASKLPRIGFLAGIPVKQLDGAFIEGLREAGYIRGRNLLIETRFYRAEDRADEFASELVALKCGAIFAGNPYGIRALTKATATVPIVGVDLEDDPVASGWIESLARPGGNLTGLFLDIPQLGGKLVEFLRDAVPTLSHLAVLWDETIDSFQLRATERAARTAGITLESLPIRRVEDINGALERSARVRIEGLVALSSPLVFRARSQIAEFALRNRLPAICLFTSFPRAGGLMAYGPNLASMWKQAASYIARILAGARPGELPVERPSKFDLVVNLRTAKTLGLAVPRSVLAEADEVIE